MVRALRRRDFPDGRPVSAPRGIRRPPWVNSTLWMTLNAASREGLIHQWHDFYGRGLTMRGAAEEYRCKPLPTVEVVTTRHMSLVHAIVFNHQW
eukprot:2715254-Amphidinium_carterae.2